MCAYLSVNIDCPLINFHRNTYHFKWAPIMKGFCYSLSFSLSMCSLHEPMAFVIVSITRWFCFGGHKTILMCRFNKIHSVFLFYFIFSIRSFCRLLQSLSEVLVCLWFRFLLILSPLFCYFFYFKSLSYLSIFYNFLFLSHLLISFRYFLYYLFVS